jgi:hypothetical protein
MKTCLRCGDDSEASAVGAALANFVCDFCRLDDGTWHWGTDTTRRQMERQMTSEAAEESDGGYGYNPHARSHNDAPRIPYGPEIVIWADGKRDASRNCIDCGSKQCSHGRPVHNESYKERANERR